MGEIIPDYVTTPDKNSQLGVLHIFDNKAEKESGTLPVKALCGREISVDKTKDKIHFYKSDLIDFLRTQLNSNRKICIQCVHEIDRKFIENTEDSKLIYLGSE
ncbi:hypothetical protein CLV96_0316 [Leptospira meyeri]|uniref:Uncharacterized protein n=1 Tax=Leptospira meyeri TaxID=29508 RepID=A0A4R8MQM6_LEPME|nr:hypothetical protein [Leptospira meyeri]TDY71354.1 hypothetical protein CLV96_0316 [Leptospira meyeri]